jgi:hypothetical protein
VVPGYVRCPKCHAPLPSRRAPSAIHFGGTAVETRRFPVGAIVIVVATLVAGIAAYFALRGKGSADQPVPTPAAAVGSQPSAAQPAGESAAPPSTFTQATVHPGEVGADLERTLKRMHLWATVEVGTRTVDVRSSSCGDPSMRPVLDAAAPRFKAAGLTRLRCLEQSGSVVFTRDL